MKNMMPEIKLSSRVRETPVVASVEDLESEEDHGTYGPMLRKLKVTVCLVVLLYMIASSDAFSQKPVLSDGLLDEMFGLHGFWLFVKESWMLFVTVGLYLAARQYNLYLDKREAEELERLKAEEG